jgi:hypothetical protein
MILSAREGVQEKEIKTHLQVLREAKYRVKTAHGVSPNWFQSTLALPILGLLQGSAAVSAMWTLLSSLMLTVLSLHCQPGRFLTPRPEFYSERQGEAFVDDTTLWNTSYLIACILVIVAKAAMKAQAWAGILFVCGQK